MIGRSSSTAASFSTIDASVTTSRTPRRAEVITSFRLEPTRPREDVPAAVELALHAADDVARVAVERQVVGRGKEEPLGAVAVDAELAQERRVGRRVEEVAQRDDVLVLETARHVEAGPALGERDARACPPTRGARGAP